jgi:hypothetical protein
MAHVGVERGIELINRLVRAVGVCEFSAGGLGSGGVKQASALRPHRLEILLLRGRDRIRRCDKVGCAPCQSVAREMVIAITIIRSIFGPAGVVANVRSHTCGIAMLFPGTLTAPGAGAMMQPKVLLTGGRDAYVGRAVRPGATNRDVATSYTFPCLTGPSTTGPLTPKPTRR